MELNIDPAVLEAYGFLSDNVSIKTLGSGQINSTFLVSSNSDPAKYVLQRINTQVFTEPEIIAANIDAVSSFLRVHYPDYLFPAPIKTVYGESTARSNGEYWRLLPFVENTIALDVLSEPVQANQAAKQFGKLSRMLAQFDASTLKPTIPGFHDLDWRFEQFHFALSQAKPELSVEAKREIEYALNHQFILAYYKSFEHSKDFPDRVMHHDTKISNVLLDADNYHGVCVIDLDTLMPGKFISDLGDMMRTYLSAFSENETDFSKVKIRLPFFKAMIAGYLSEMGDILTATERELILFSGKYVIYMQALRFLTDYLSGNIYYPISYPNQNLDRAKNQFKLLRELFENERVLQDIIEECLTS